MLKNSYLLDEKLIISIPDHNDIILYGPFLSLSKGKYRIKLELDIPNKLMNLLYIDIVSENCSSTIIKQRLIKSEEIKQGYRWIIKRSAEDRYKQEASTDKKRIIKYII